MMPNVINMPDLRAGATPDDWNTLVWGLELTEDLLPVVSNLKAEISLSSSMKALGKTPSQYNSTRRVVGFSQWTQHVTTLDEINVWSKERDYGICIQTRSTRAIDVDISDNEIAQDIYNYISAQYNLPKRYRDNAAKFLLAFRCPGQLPKRVIRSSHGIIEFLGTGQQFIACGTHTSGARYQWDGGLPDSIPALTLEEFEALWSGLQENFGVGEATESKTTTRHEVINNILVADPVAQHLIARDVVRSVGKDKELRIFCPFIDEHSGDSGETETIYYPAHTNGHAHGAFKCLHAHCEERTKQEFLDAVGYIPPNPFDDITEPAETFTDVPAVVGDAPELKYKTITTDVMRKMEPPEWIVKKMVPKATVGMIFGASGSGKSFLALDLAMSIARGVDWRDRKVKQAPVMYLCAEDATGFMSRVHAYEHQHGLTPGAYPFHFLDASPNITKAPDVVDIIKTVKACGAKVVFIDTVAQTSPGTDENSGKEMGVYLDHCKTIHSKTGAMVILLHHAGKDSSKGARGWSGMHAAMDMVIEVIRADNYRAATLTKVKGGEDGKEFPFELDPVVLGFDDDDDEVTSCVLQHNTNVKPKPKDKGPKGAVEKRVLSVLEDLIEQGTTKVDYRVLVDKVKDQMPVSESGRDQRRRHIDRAINSLVDAGRVEVDSFNSVTLG